MKIKLVIIDTFSRTQDFKEVKYFYEGNHIENFRYSPEGCQKLVETDFKAFQSIYSAT